jgi:small-conductance mechanosensitive channel
MEIILNNLDALFIQGFIGSLSTIIITIIIVFIGNHFIKKWIKKRWADNPKVALRIKNILLWTIVLTTSFTQIIPLRSLATTLLASGGIVALVIGLASQEAASSMINGAMIFTYKPYTTNDVISIPEHNVRGKVIDITLRHTVLETLEKTTLIIPNTIMNQNMIENISNIPDQKANYLTLDIRYDGDIDKAIEIMQGVASKHPFCIDVRSKEQQDTPKIPVYCTEVKDNIVSLRATMYSKNGDEGFVMISDVRQEVIKAFKENDIPLPYPTMIMK